MEGFWEPFGRLLEVFWDTFEQILEKVCDTFGHSSGELFMYCFVFICRLDLDCCRCCLLSVVCLMLSVVCWLFDGKRSSGDGRCSRVKKSRE